MKDHELQRIPDKLQYINKAQTVVTDHKSMRKTERHDTGFMNTKNTGLFAAKAKEATLR